MQLLIIKVPFPFEMNQYWEFVEADNCKALQKMLAGWLLWFYCYQRHWLESSIQFKSSEFPILKSVQKSDPKLTGLRYNEKKTFTRKANASISRPACANYCGLLRLCSKIFDKLGFKKTNINIKKGSASPIPCTPEDTHCSHVFYWEHKPFTKTEFKRDKK